MRFNLRKYFGCSHQPDFRSEYCVSPEPRLHRLVSVVVGLQEPVVALAVLHPGPGLLPPEHHHEVLGILLAQTIAVPPLHHHAADHVRPHQVNLQVLLVPGLDIQTQLWSRFDLFSV